MGWSLVRGASAFGEVHERASRPLGSIFTRAVLTCLLNPKAYIFTIAVFPQFLRPDYGSIVGQSVVLSTITALTQAGVYGGVAVGAAGLRGWLRNNAAAQVLMGRSVGALLLLVAVWTAWKGWQHGQ
jgi:threonine/homoserine/homoserine lactone efflux protein